MTHGIYVEPTAASFSVTPAQYVNLQAELHSDSRVSRLVLTATGGSGTVEGVDFSWSYDGTAHLIVAIVKKHGLLTEHYPNASIFDELDSKFFGKAPYTTGQAKTTPAPNAA